MTKEQILAEHIIDAVGGIDNMDNIINCMTRLELKYSMKIKLITNN